MPNLVAKIDSYTPEGDFVRMGMSMHSVGGYSGIADVFIPLTSLDQTVTQINNDLRDAVSTFVLSQGHVFSGGEKVILIGCFG